MLLLKPYARVVIIQSCLRFLFYALFIGIGAWMVTQFELGSGGFWMTAGVVLVGSVQCFRDLRKLRPELEGLKDTNYVLRKSELAVVNQRSGVERVYRPSEIASVEAFKVPFGYQVRIYRIGETKEHRFRILGARIFAGEDAQIPEEEGLLTLRRKEDVEEILSAFRSA